MNEHLANKKMDSYNCEEAESDSDNDDADMLETKTNADDRITVEHNNATLLTAKW